MVTWLWTKYGTGILRPDALPDIKPKVTQHWRKMKAQTPTTENQPFLIFFGPSPQPICSHHLNPGINFFEHRRPNKLLLMLLQDKMYVHNANTAFENISLRNWSHHTRSPAVTNYSVNQLICQQQQTRNVGQCPTWWPPFNSSFKLISLYFLDYWRDVLKDVNTNIK